jgi:transposase-like protein
VPQNASRSRVSPALIATYLARAQLPEATVALAACILDSLSSRFVRAWRRECEEVNTSQHSAHSLRITAKPELIVLAALAVASGFLDDVKGEPRWWIQNVTEDTLNLREFDATMRCVYKDLNYDLCSFTAEEVDEMRLDLYPAARVRL